MPSHVTPVTKSTRLLHSSRYHLFADAIALETDKSIMANLVELDSLEIKVIIDNELDPVSPCPNEAVQQYGSLKDMGVNGASIHGTRGAANRELRMDGICCSAHGLSLMITAVKGDRRRTMLFDTGPEESAWERNARRLQADIGKIETIHLSHWHRDHSGGMLKAVKMINEAKQQGDPVNVDLHPDRPDYRGVMAMEPVSLEADPTFDEVAGVGGKVQKNDKAHTILDGSFLISGEIPRVTPYELGLRRGIRYIASRDEWEEDTLIRDERLVMCKLKGRSWTFLSSYLMHSAERLRQGNRDVYGLQPRRCCERCKARR